MKTTTPLVCCTFLALLAPPSTGNTGLQGGAAPSAGGPLEELGSLRPDIEALCFDRPGDGNLWVRGVGYKARFGADAFEFIPFLGSDAPRNFPLRLQLESLTLGGTPLRFEAGVEPELGGPQERTVSYDRGSLVEHYIVAADSIEQRFRLERPAGFDAATTGDLVLRLAVEGELEGRTTGEGFRFENARGGVRYGRALALDPTGLVAASPTRLLPGGLEIRVPAQVLAAATWPLTIDPVIQPFNVVSGNAVTAYPDLAYDQTHDRYAITWEVFFSQNDSDVFVQMHGPSGAAISGSGNWMDVSTDHFTRPRIANNNNSDQFLVVAVEGVGAPRMITGRTRAAGSTDQGPKFRVSGLETGDKVSVDVGGDPVPLGPSYYCVTWVRFLNGDGDIHAQIVTPDSQLLGAGTISIWSSVGTHDIKPAISKSNGGLPADTQRWTIVWERSYAFNDNDIYGAQLSWDGQIVQPAFPIDTDSASNDQLASVSSVLDQASGERRYLVAWRGNADIKGRLMQGATPVTPTTNLTALENAGNLALSQTTPDVEADGSTFTLVYAEAQPGTGNDIYFSDFDFMGAELVCSEGHIVAASSSNTEINPRLASRANGGATTPGFMAAWNDISAGTTNIDGALAFPRTIGHVYCSSLPNSSGVEAKLQVSGQRSRAAESVQLNAFFCPPSKPGLFFLGSGQVDVPFGGGRRCVGGAVKRLPVTSTDSSGHAVQDIDFSAPYAAGIVSGSPGVNYQFWFRDQAHSSSSNTTEAVHVEYLP